MNKNKDLSLASRGLNYKLKIAFALMSILPLLVSTYLVSNYILPKAGFKLDIAVSMLVSIFIAVIGFFVIKEIFDRITSVSSIAKMIAAGDLSRKIDVEREDEVGDLGDSLNQLTERIRSNMDELKSYSEKTTQINLEIQKRVLVLSSLLQISSLISQGAKLEDILRLITEKARLLAESDTSYLLFLEEETGAFYTKVVDGLNLQHISKLKIDPGHEIYNRLVKINKAFVLDRDNILPENTRLVFAEHLKLKNLLIVPVFLLGKTIGVLGIGNTQADFYYKKDDLDLMDILARQVAISVENDVLMHRVEKLEIKDALTGLYNESFIRNRLQEEIKRAIRYQRPCAFTLFNIDNFKEFQNEFGLLHSEAALKKIANLIRESVTDIDRVARSGDNEFAVVLPEKNKRQALDLAEEIRKKVEFSFSEEQQADKRLTISGSVSENPLDGVDAEKLIVKAKESLNLAKNQGKNRISG